MNLWCDGSRTQVCTVYPSAPDEYTALIHNLPKPLTGNQAEYNALAVTAEWADEVDLGEGEFIIHSDSKLVVDQLQGRAEVKDIGLKHWWNYCTVLLGDSCLSLVWCPREENLAGIVLEVLQKRKTRQLETITQKFEQVLKRKVKVNLVKEENNAH